MKEPSKRLSQNPAFVFASKRSDEVQSSLYVLQAGLLHYVRNGVRAFCYF